jgi:hypothetical protein
MYFTEDSLFPENMQPLIEEAAAAGVKPAAKASVATPAADKLRAIGRSSKRSWRTSDFVTVTGRGRHRCRSSRSSIH